MSTLHIISQSPFTSDNLQQCLRVCGQRDAILFIQDGVYVVQQTEALLVDAHCDCYVLSEDLAARGLSLDGPLRDVDYTGFVALICDFQNSVNWS